MFKLDAATDKAAKPAEAKEPPRRVGLPVDPRRIVAALKSARWKLVVVALACAVVGALVGKLVVKKTYLAQATVLWEPPAAARAEAGREITTLVASVKLPANVLKVRETLGRTETVEQLGKDIDVKVGESSMLIAITAKAPDRDDAAAIANAMVAAFLDAQREVSANRLREVAVGLRQSLGQAETALDEARKKYDGFRAQNGVAEFSVDVQGAITELARLRIAANDARVELQGLQAREASLRRSRATNPENVVVSRNEQNNDAARLAQLETELAEKRSKYSDDHPEVRALSAEVAALKARAGAAPVVTSQVVGRNPMRDTLGLQLEESSAVRKAVEERTKALADLTREAERRAQQLTGAQGEAARLLADVKVNEEHVAALLKQIAMAEDDVRGATSNFQIVSRATPPERSEKGVGRIVAIALPVVGLLLAVLAVVVRELAPLRVRTASEAAYWCDAPVLCATKWPAVEPASKGAAKPKAAASSGAKASAATSDGEPSRIAREIADAIEGHAGVLGVSFVGVDSPRAVVDLVARALRRRRVPCAVHDASVRSPRSKVPLADVLERRAFGDRVARARRGHRIVFVLLPSLADADAVRAAQRWLDGTLVVLESGAASMTTLGRVRARLGIEREGLGVVLVRDALTSGAPPIGALASLWRARATEAAKRHPRRREPRERDDHDPPLDDDAPSGIAPISIPPRAAPKRAHSKT